MKQISRVEAWLKSENGRKAFGKELPVVINTEAKNVYKITAPAVFLPFTGMYLHKGQKVKFKGLEIDLPVKTEGQWEDLKKDELKTVMVSLRIGATAETEAESDKEIVEEVTPEVTVETPEETPEETAPDLNAMTKKNIASWAAEKGIEVDASLSKADMIATIEGSL